MAEIYSFKKKLTLAIEVSYPHNVDSKLEFLWKFLKKIEYFS